MKVENIARVLRRIKAHDRACHLTHGVSIDCSCGLHGAHRELCTLEQVLQGECAEGDVMRRSPHRPEWLDDEDALQGRYPDDDQDRLVEWIRELEQRVLVLSVAMRAGAAAAAPAVRPVESIDHCQVSDDRVGGLATIDLRVTVSNNHPLVAATLGFFKAPPVPPASGATGGGG